MIREKDYEVLKNPENELLFGITAKEDTPKDPKMIYDGGEHALFYRNKGKAVLLDFLPPIAKENLANQKKVLFVEFDENEKLVYEYEVDIKNVDNLPT